MSEVEKFLKFSVCCYCKQKNALECKTKCVLAKYAEKGYNAGVAAERQRHTQETGKNGRV